MPRCLIARVPRVVVAFCLTTTAQAQAPRTPLTIDRLMATPSLTGTTPATPKWAPTSRAVAFLWNEAGQPARTLWTVERNGAAPHRVLAASDTAPVTDFVWSAAGEALVYAQGDAVKRVTLRTHAVDTILADGGEHADLALSPDGRTLSYLHDGDLWLLPTNTATPMRLTSVAVGPIGTVPLGTYFRRDVEIGSATWGGDAPTYAWAPDGRSIAVHYVDRRGVPTIKIPYYLGSAPTMNVVRRGAPGDANEVRMVGIVDVGTHALRFIHAPDSSATQIVNFAWSPRGELLIDSESDDAIDRHVCFLENASAALRCIWHDHRDTRIYNEAASTWDIDGKSILFTGDLADRYGIYRFSPDDSMPRLLTSDAFDVTGAAIPNIATRTITYVSAEPLPSERHVWRMRADGSQRQRLTTSAGTHTPFVSPDGASIALLSSSDATPLELYLLDVKAGATERRITHSQAPDFAATPWIRPQYVTIPGRAGTPPLHLRILFPANLDSTRSYPVLFGPVYSNTVRNRWEGRYAALQQYLALEKRYIVVQVDVRGSTGYGRDFREKFLMDWGGGDLDDLESAVDYMKSLRFVEKDRFGIWGSSYGGTLTVYSLLKKPGLFQAGVAGAPATEPRFFGSDDVAIARRPQTHPQAFTRGALQFAGNLRDHLLIIHGMEDDVVPFATSVALAEEFMRLGKSFDFAFAPAATHGWTQRPYYATYLMKRLVEHFDRYLGPGLR